MIVFLFMISICSIVSDVINRATHSRSLTVPHVILRDDYLLLLIRVFLDNICKLIQTLAKLGYFCVFLVLNNLTSLLVAGVASSTFEASSLDLIL